MNKRIILSIAKKEFFSYINSALAYTIIVPFLLLSIFLFLQNVLVTGEATLRPYFDLLPWFLLLVAPALSMKLLTDEYKNNTLELLFAHPISELDIVLGKFFGATAFYFCILFTTIGLPLTILSFSKPDLGQIAGQYIGALFIGSTFIAIGLSASSYVKNAISSFLLAASIGFVFIIIGFDFVTLILPFPFNKIAGELSILNHTESVARGLLDVRDIAFFVTLIGLCLTGAIAKLSERKLAEDNNAKKKLHLAYILIIAIGVILNILLSSYPLRLDLTQAKLFTLSAGTKQTIINLPDLVNIRVFTSRSLPSQLQGTLRQITDLLSDYEKLSNKVNVQVINPESSLEAANEARGAGIQEVTFNRIGSGKFEAQSGYLGIAVRYGDKTESIPFISDTSDLEYQLTRRIRKITQDKDKIIGIYTNGYSQNQILTKLLETQYKIERLNVDDNVKLKNISSLIVIDNGSSESSASALVKEYLEKNGKVLFLANGVSVNTQMLTANKSQSTVASLLKDYGVTLNNDLVYDLQLNELLTFGQGNTRYLAPYPFWLRALPVDESFLPLRSIKSISLGWPSSLKIEEKQGFTYKKLLITSKNAGKSENNFNISPQALNTLTSTDKQLLGVSVEKGEMKLVVIGASTIADDQFMDNNRDNIAFVSNTIDWLSSDRDLAVIPAKTSGRPVFTFRSPVELVIVQYSNLLIPPVLVIGFAIIYLRRRKLLTLRNYNAK